MNKRILPLAAAGLATAALALGTAVGTGSAQASGSACSGPLDILMTNDDGWQAPGIQAVRAALVEAGHHVTVVAPATDQSGKGGSITTGGALRLERRLEGDNPVWSVAGTPVDSLRVGLAVVLAGDRPDLVVSGANIGENVARGIASGSGTVGAAYAATNDQLGSIPALDISVGLNLAEAGSTPRFGSTLAAFPEAGDFVAGLVADLQDDCRDGRLLPEYQQLHINYPPLPADRITGTEITELATVTTPDLTYSDPAGAVAAGSGDVRIGFTVPDPARLDGDGRALHDGKIAIVVFDGDMSAPTEDVSRLRVRLGNTL